MTVGGAGAILHFRCHLTSQARGGAGTARWCRSVTVLKSIPSLSFEDKHPEISFVLLFSTLKINNTLNESMNILGQLQHICRSWKHLEPSTPSGRFSPGRWEGGCFTWLPPTGDNIQLLSSESVLVPHLIIQIRRTCIQGKHRWYWLKLLVNIYLEEYIIFNLKQI